MNTLLHREEITKEDGRYLIFYTFPVNRTEGGPEPTSAGEEPETKRAATAGEVTTVRAES